VLMIFEYESESESGSGSGSGSGCTRRMERMGKRILGVTTAR